MPWITNQDGIREYKLSIYTKEELPTWDEIYNEWYIGKQFIYDPFGIGGNIQDLYWKIPHKKYLEITVCNQLNKMIYEDGFKDQVLSYLSSQELINQELMFEFIDIRFIITSRAYESLPKTSDQLNEYVKFLKDTGKLGTSESPLIYSITMPDGSKNPFIVNNDNRVYFDQSQEYIRQTAIGIFLYCRCKSYNITDGPILAFMPFNDPDGKYKFIIDYMMEPFRSYFENGVGWKDQDGKLIEASVKPVIGCDFGE